MSAQGEHIFNALGDLAEELAGVLRGRINPNATAERRTRALTAIQRLETLAEQFIRSRNNTEFRTASVGDPANDQRYSRFARDTRSAIDRILPQYVNEVIVSDGGSTHTRGYVEMTRFHRDITYYTVDAKAQESRMGDFKGKKRKEAEYVTWYNTTRDLLSELYRALLDAAMAVNATYIP